MNDNIIGETIQSLKESVDNLEQSHKHIEDFYRFTIRFLEHIRTKPDELNSSYPHWVKKCDAMMALYDNYTALKVDHIKFIMQSVNNLTIAKDIADAKTPKEKLSSYLSIMSSVNAPVSVCIDDIIRYTDELINETIKKMMTTPTEESHE